MSEIPAGTSVIQPNGLLKTEGIPNPQFSIEGKEPISPAVSFSDPNVNLIPPANVSLEDQSSVIT